MSDTRRDLEPDLKEALSEMFYERIKRDMKPFELTGTGAEPPVPRCPMCHEVYPTLGLKDKA